MMTVPIRRKGQPIMIGLGILLALLGAGSLILPELGYQLRIMEPLQDAQPAAGIAVLIVGVALVGAAVVRRNRARQAVPPAA